MTTHHTSGAADLPEALQSVTYFTAAEGAFGEACANAAPSTRIKEIVWLDGRPDEVLLNDLHICVAVTNAGKMLVGYSRTNRAAALDAALAPPAMDGGDAEDAALWRMLPAFFEEYQIDAMKLYRDIDAARAAQKGGV